VAIQHESEGEVTLVKIEVKKVEKIKATAYNPYGSS
jgi:hypothetical protein